jgi:hypothetical protein
MPVMKTPHDSAPGVSRDLAAAGEVLCRQPPIRGAWLFGFIAARKRWRSNPGRFEDAGAFLQAETRKGRMIHEN